MGYLLVLVRKIDKNSLFGGLKISRRELCVKGVFHTISGVWVGSLFSGGRWNLGVKNVTLNSKNKPFCWCFCAILNTSPGPTQMNPDVRRRLRRIESRAKNSPDSKSPLSRIKI